ncbi:MAG: DUF5723 family protein [Flavobacteriales bacterium]
MHDELPQSNRIYPQSMLNDTACIIALPSASFYVGNSGFSYDDIVASDGDSASLTYEKMISQLRPNNYLNAQVSIPFFMIMRRWGNWQIAFHQAEVLSINVRYTREMAEFLWYGNSKFIGKEVNLAPDAELLRYYESALTIARNVGKWNLGASFKYLEGVSCISVQGNKLNVFTEMETYNLSINTDIEIHQSNTNQLARIGVFPTSWFKNPGFSLDIGASRSIGEKWRLSSSVTNLGFLRWRRSVKTLRSQNRFQFDGLDLSSFVLGDSLNLEDYEDSVMHLLSFTETQGKFTSYTVPRFQAGINYLLKPNLKVGVFQQLQFLNRGTQLSMSSSLIREFDWRAHSLNAGIHYTYRNRTPFNFGLSIDCRWRFLQFFVMSDNMLSWILPKARVPLSLFDSKSEDSIIIPKQLRSINFHFGINLFLTKQRGINS